MSTRTSWPISRAAPIRTSSPPSTSDGRGGRLIAPPWAAPGPLADGPSATRQPYAGGGCRRGPAPTPDADGGGRTEVVEHALRAARRPGETDPAAVQDQPEAEPGPFLGWEHLGHLG